MSDGARVGIRAVASAWRATAASMASIASAKST